MGHRKFLNSDHEFRKNAQHFDGTEEYGRPPPLLSGDEVINELKNFKLKFGKTVDDNPELPYNWKKMSIFFDLPYWKDNVIRHNLDLMHIEKNVCESICGTLLNMKGKTKDNIKSRLDLQEIGIRSALHPIEKGPSRVSLPPACYSMGKKQKGIFCKVLKKVKVPDGYASNISRCVQLKPAKLIGLKSHDNHILMQQLLPVALRRTLSKSVWTPLIKLSRYFRELCCKLISPTDAVRLRTDIVVILCQLEKIFPPSFFDIMIHLTVHLATEVQLVGPVPYRWMYPFERYLGTLKSYVRNRSRPEGSIAEGYLAEECLTFCSLYLADYVETKFNQSTRNDDTTIDSTLALDVFTNSGYAIGKAIATKFDDETLKKAHQYVLFNCHHIQSYIQEHREILNLSHSGLPPHQIERMHSESFASWFAKHIENINLPQDDPVTNDLKSLAGGPNFIGIQYAKFVSNGFRFHTKEVERKRKTHNFGVIVRATTSSYSSIRDQNPI
ncbi:uncharacterized protein [Henckelia pumila]|uniref:uncharacterized protein isoform X1 n=2 Tax=Henckelia pumila TaxID=405737 RepID=UPI003C6E517A